MQKYILILCLAFAYMLASAQDINTSLSWQKKAKLAKQAVKSGEHDKAGQYYYSAWTNNSDKSELAYQAGENFFKAHNYLMAAKAYEAVKTMNKKFKQAGYRYALSLKRSGDYGAALAAFETYNAAPDAGMKTDIEQHIAGCRLAQEFAADAASSDIQAQHAGFTLNSDKAEFAPLPFGNNRLYFTSLAEGEAKIYTSDRNGERWLKPKAINMPDAEKDHYGNATFTPDMQKLYFTQCDIDKKGISKCHIYLMNKDGGMWTEPVKLSDGINAPDAHVTHPALVVDGEQEYLYFASDRTGGYGGLDIWYVFKNVNEDTDKFSDPINLGQDINTAQDEITPYFNLEEQTLYFSSNGHPNIGGFDVFKVEKRGKTWSRAQNMGLPVNSSSDDMHYVCPSESSMAYLVSKRTAEGIKTIANDDDIFIIQNPLKEELAVTTPKLKLPSPKTNKDDVIETISNDPIDINTVPDQPLFSNSKTVSQTPAADTIIKPTAPVIESVPRTVENTGQATQAVPRDDRTRPRPSVQSTAPRPEVSTTSSEYGEIYSQPIKTKEGYWVIGISPTFTEPTQAQGSYSLGGATQTASDAYRPTTTYTPSTYTPPPPVVTSSTTYTTPAYTNTSNTSGRVYRIQISARKVYQPSRYQKVSDMGSIVLEDVETKNGKLTRIMIDGFYSESDARNALAQAKARGYESAFITIYNNGVRAKRIIR